MSAHSQFQPTTSVSVKDVSAGRFSTLATPAPSPTARLGARHDPMPAALEE
jgi:hypothetical protein